MNRDIKIEQVAMEIAEILNRLPLRVTIGGYCSTGGAIELARAAVMVMEDIHKSEQLPTGGDKGSENQGTILSGGGPKVTDRLTGHGEHEALKKRVTRCERFIATMATTLLRRDTQFGIGHGVAWNSESVSEVYKRMIEELDG